MKLQMITVGPFQMNSYILYSSEGSDCILIDPADELERIYQFIEEKKLNPVAIYNTHGHIDHIRFLSLIQKKYNLPFYLHKDELFFVENLQNQGAMYGMQTAEPPNVTHFLEEGQTHSLNGETFTTILAPGHSPGSICFKFEAFLIGGDVLFYDSIGRTDLYMGNHDQLISTIHNKLMILPDNLTVFPGHGPETTIGRERAHNPFL